MQVYTMGTVDIWSGKGSNFPWSGTGLWITDRWWKENL